jgi:phosphate/sulfate permease
MELKLTSKQFGLVGSDWLKGLIMAVGTPVLYLLQEMIPQWHISPLLQAAIAATVTYLLKNFFDKQKAVISDPATVQGIEDGTIKIHATKAAA